MKKFLAILVWVCILLASSIALADDAPIGFYANGDVLSKHVWRGILINDGMIATGQAGIKFYGFDINVLGYNYLTNSRGDNRKYRFNEVDFEMSHTATFDKVFTTVGVTYYTFPKIGLVNAPNSLELFGGFGYKWFVTPVLFGYYDTDIGGMYFRTGMTKKMDLSFADVNLAGLVGYATKDVAHQRYNMASDTFSDLEASCNVLFKVWKLKMGPEVAYSRLINDTQLTQNAEQGWFGGKISLEF